MGDRHSIAEARSNLPRLVREVELGKPVELTRRGEPVAVLIGHGQYERLTGKFRAFFDAFQDFQATVDLAELDIDPDDVFAGSRDDSRGRDVRL